MYLQIDIQRYVITPPIGDGKMYQFAFRIIDTFEKNTNIA